MRSVDVIVPCYRYAHYLTECVESILSQEGVSVRVLIIDDASPDNTADIAATLMKNDSRVNFIQHKINAGHIATYNEGIDWVSADYMLLLSADDYLLPGALRRAVDLLSSDSQIGFTFGRVQVLEKDGSQLIAEGLDLFVGSSGTRVLSGREFVSITCARCIVPGPSAVVRTSLQKRLGGYRADLPHAGDMEMWLRFAANAKVGVIGEPQAVYRRHDANMSRDFYAEGKMPDLLQRKRTIEIFFHSSAHLLADSHTLRRRMLRQLGFDALGYASSAFNIGELTLSSKFVDIAKEIDPRAPISIQYAKLRFKMLVGLEAWRAMSGVYRRLLSHAARYGMAVKVRSDD